MKVNQATIDLIKSFEGYSAVCYHDKIDREGVDTVGFGTIKYPPDYLGGKDVRVGDPSITVVQALAFLQWEVDLKAAAITPMIKVPLNDNQFGALVSFAYNLGEGALEGSTLLKKVNANPKDSDIRSEFLKWVNAGPIKNIPGLVRRRSAEASLYESQVNVLENPSPVIVSSGSPATSSVSDEVIPSVSHKIQLIDNTVIPETNQQSFFSSLLQFILSLLGKKV